MAAALLGVQTSCTWGSNTSVAPSVWRLSGKRRAAGAGRFPLLEALGLEHRVTPLLVEAIARQTVLSSSLHEARTQLAYDGPLLDISTLLRVAVSLGEQALNLRDEALQQAIKAPLPPTSVLAGQRIQVSIDGGRSRTRSTDHKARIGQNGRRPFSTAWREPRLTNIDRVG